VDVHKAKNLFALKVRDPATDIRGSTDGCVCDTAHAGLDAYSAARSAVCLIELKTPEALRDFTQKCETQAILELFGASTLCGYPVPVVLTSLEEPRGDVPGIRIFALDGGVVRDFIGAEGGPMTLAEARGVLRVLLPRVLAARKKYISAKLASVPELGLDDDEDDEGRDSDVPDDDEGDEDYAPPAPAGGKGGGASAAPAPASRSSARIANGARGGGSASAGLAKDVACSRAPALSSADASLYADLEEEERGRRMCALISRSPQILQILQRGTQNR
jgi:hypothetical protein